MKNLIYVLSSIFILLTHPADAQIFTMNGDQSGDFFGYSVSAIGDINHDGFNDFLIGAPQAREMPLPPLVPGQHPIPGYAKIISGRDGAVLYYFSGVEHNDRFGWSTAGLGDIDHDQTPDLVIGSPALNIGVPGKATVITHSNQFILNGTQSDDWFGYDVADGGDLNGDQVDDVIVSAPAANSNQGIVWIFSGADIHSGQGAALVQQLQVPGSYGLGSDVAGAGDVNHDGFPDLAVGSWNNHLYIFWGNGAGVNPIPTDIDLGAFVASVEGVGDLNGDGFDDVVASSETNSSVFLFLGNASGISTTPIVIAPPSTLSPDQHYVGYSLTKARDFNCDGSLDLAVGVPLSDAGKTHLLSYNGTTNTFGLLNDGTLSGHAPNNQFGFSISASWMGGPNSSSHLIVGEPMGGAGSASIYRYECGASPTPTPSPTPTQTTTSTGSASLGGPGTTVSLGSSAAAGCSSNPQAQGIEVSFLTLLFAPFLMMVWSRKRAKESSI